MVLNSTNAGRQFVLGGSFADAPWQFRDQDAQFPFERRAGFGLRLIEQAAPLEAKLTNPIATVERDPASLKPVSDAVYQVYVRQFDYDQNGSLLQRSQGLESAPRITRYSYDGFDRLIGLIDAGGAPPLDQAV
jgi:hypothetical protein